MNFWPSFFANLLATFIGVALGMFASLFTNSRIEEAGRQRERSGRLGTSRDALSELLHAFELNRSSLGAISETTTSDQYVIVPVIDYNAWQTLAPYVDREVLSPTQRQKLSHHFLRLQSLERVYARLTELFIGPSAALHGAESTRENYIGTSLWLARDLIEVADGLVEELEKVRDALPTAD